MFKGSLPALITAFCDGELDIPAFAGLVARQIEAGAHGVVVCGTTGECATLNPEEQYQLIQTALDTAAGRIPVIAGTGTCSTAQTIQKTNMAAGLGADAALVVVPYYNKPSQEGLYQHFKAVHDATDIPIIPYNVPGRTVVEIDTDTVILN